ncbi:MAG: RNA polymerase sigma factor [Rudanella sp.]|nr:RNA polymerase sigma factor [Rudanella sp.]
MSNAANSSALPELLAGCLRNQRRSQELLYRQFYGYAMSICMRYTNSREQALDVLNDGFLKVFTRLDQYDTTQPFKGWLRRIMINTALDQYRASVRHQHEDLSEAMHASTDTADVHSQLAHEELIELIQQLSPAYRLVFSLYVIDGYNHEEIATRLLISVGSSKSNLARARENLRAMIQKKTNDEYARATR